MENNKYLVPLAVIVAGAMVAGAIYFGSGNTGTTAKKTSGQDQQTQPIDIPLATASDHIIGSLDAEVVIIEYSDTECPWCKVFHETMHQVVNEYVGQVAWIYRHMPFHNQSAKEAQATECAYELGGNTSFWNYLDKLFEITPSNDGLDLAKLPEIANEVGLNSSSFGECLSSQRYLDEINKNLDLATPEGIVGTPYSIMISKSGKRAIINGAESPTMVKAKIDALIKN